MGIQTTEPIATSTDRRPRWERLTLADQASAFAALAALAAEQLALPGAYITVSNATAEVTVQAHTWLDWEAWRVALGVAPHEVDLGSCEPVREHVEFTATVRGVTLRVYSLGDLVKQAGETAAAVTA
ncbi:hypothetical protein OG411_19135 [Streptomyces pseudogriseolus]|uniref:hypothetical protein n=1 Tax=Streptomyces pseudogriseolus TaxID=36817 RepID=UPI003255B6E6